MQGSVYILVGLWVHPDHRRRGLGKKLVDDGFDWVRRNTPSIRENRVDGDHKKILSLAVYHSNKSAIALYEMMGFKQVQVSGSEGVPADSTGYWMAAYVN
jgi:ribosomal protein S18 acetylase RimI-like enzyme